MNQSIQIYNYFNKLCQIQKLIISDNFSLIESIIQIKYKQFSLSLAMNLIALKNFKSYQDQLINNLNSHINIVMGKNGNGKSNFFKGTSSRYTAINFALTDKIKLSSNEFNNYTHRAVDNQQRPISVEVYYRSEPNTGKDSTNIYKIQRIWTPDLREQLKVDDKTFSKSQFQTFLESVGLAYSNSYNIIQQGKITEILMMDDTEIYKLIEEVTGLRKFQKRQEETLGYLKKNQQQKVQIKEVIQQIEGRLKIFDQRREQFEYINIEQMSTKLKSKNDLQEELKIVEKQLNQLKENEAYSSQFVTKTKLKIKQLQGELQQMDAVISIDQKQAYQFYEDGAMSTETQQAVKNMTQTQKDLNGKIKKIKIAKDKLRNQFERASNQVQNIREEIKPYKDKFQTLTALIEAEKLSKDGNKTEGKKQLKNIIQKYQNSAKELEGQIKKIEKLKNQYKISSINKQNQQISSCKQNLIGVHKNLKDTKIKYFQALRLKNQQQSQLDVLKKQADSYYSKMRKRLPLLNFELLNQIKKQKIPGVYGFLIEFVDIQPTVAFAYETAGLYKLCSLLVQDQSVCQLVANLNTRIKGRQVNILPLNFVANQAIQKKNYPNIDDCFSLLNEDWIKIKPHSYGSSFDTLVKKIIQNTFNRHVLVKDYELGLSVSKEYFLNCITADQQIIYSQGYLCKVGKDTNIDDRIQLYFKYAQKIGQVWEIEQKLFETSKIVVDFQNMELDIMRKKTDIQLTLQMHNSKINEIQEQERSLTKLNQETNSLQDKRNKIINEISRKEQILNNLDKKKGPSVNMKEYKELEQLYQNKMQVFNAKCQNQCELQTKLIKLSKDQQELIAEHKKIHQDIALKKQINNDFLDNQGYKKKIVDELKQLTEKRKYCLSEIKNLEDDMRQKQAGNYKCLTQITFLEERFALCQEKLTEIGQIDVTLEQIQQKSNSHSFSRTINNSNHKKIIVTTRDRFMFSKLDAYYEKYKEQTKKYKMLQENESQILQTLHKYEKEKDICLNQMFSKFQKEFERLFKDLTIHGKTDVRLLKNKDKSRGFVKSKNQISVMVSFEAKKDPVKRWNEYSAGQKTVIAVCLLMALQKCKPAAFYILDEMDAALDPVYLQRIVKIIKQDCVNSQYFITSFKRQMLQFPEQICNYYLVESVERVSSIRRVSQDQAQALAQNILE